MDSCFAYPPSDHAYLRNQREKLIAKAKKLINNPGKLTNNGSNDPKQYITKVSVNSSNGDVNNDIETLYNINLDLINKQAALDGFYCVATNLADDDNDTIIDAMKYRWFIEDSFKVIKQYFDFRPVRHSKTNRIRSHFTICFLTLLVYRYFQKICHESKFESLKNITDEELFDVLKSYNLNIVKKDFYLPAFNLNSQTKDLEELFNVYLSNEIMTPAYISKVIKSKKNN